MRDEQRRPAAGRRVVVTGLGAVSPYGVGVPALWDGLLAGRSTARRITRFDPDGHIVQIACEVPAFDPSAHLPPKLVRQLDPFAQSALVAAREALADAALLADPAGAGARLPRADADIGADDVDHVNAHGTSTPQNDVAEAQALRAVLGPRTDAVAVTSTKSAIGHLLGAAGGVEAVATVLTVGDGVVHPSLNLDVQDPACELDVVRREPRKVRIRAALSDSFGFGGHNAVLVFRAV